MPDDESEDSEYVVPRAMGEVEQYLFHAIGTAIEHASQEMNMTMEQAIGVLQKMQFELMMQNYKEEREDGPNPWEEGDDE
jgi:hypothetical protein